MVTSYNQAALGYNAPIGYNKAGVAITMPAVSFQVAFFGTRAGVTVSADPNDPTVTPTWVDLTHRLVKLSTKRGKSYELDEAQAQEYDLKLRNYDGALDPTNTASPYYPYVLPFRQFRLQVTYGSTYTAATGYIESWPQTWELHGAYPYVECTATDALATLSQILLPSALAAEILLDNPVGYWPLTEPSGAVMGANITANAAVPGVSQVYYGTGSSSTVGFGNTTLTTLIGAGASSTAAGAPIEGDTTGLYLSTPDSTANGVGLESGFAATYNGGGVTLECWFQSLAGHTYTVGELPLVATDYCTLLLEPTLGELTFVGPGIGFGVDTTVSVLDGKLHHIAATYNPNSQLVLYVDGVAVKTSTLASSTLPAANISHVYLGGSSSSSASIGFAPMTLAHAAVYSGVLPASRIATHHQAGVTAFAGEDTGARFTRILKYAAWNGSSLVPAGNNNMLGLYDCANKSALAALLDVCTAEQGNMYIDNLGRVVFENRHARMVQNSQAYVLGENTAAGEIPYEGDIQVNFDPQQVYNTAIIERPGGVVLNLADPTSVLRYFPRAFPNSPLSLPVADDATAIGAAQFLLGRYKDPHPRVANVKISPTATPTSWPFAMSVQIGQRIGLNRRTQSAPTVNLDLFVESVAHDYDANTGDWETSLELSPAFWQNYTLMTAARGTLAASTAAGATTVTLTVPIDAAGNGAAQQGWNTGVITAVQLVDGANTETVTVTSIVNQFTPPLTILTTAPTAYAHTAGITVAENPGAYTDSQFDTCAAFDGTRQLAY